MRQVKGFSLVSQLLSLSLSALLFTVLSDQLCWVYRFYQKTQIELKQWRRVTLLLETFHQDFSTCLENQDCGWAPQSVLSPSVGLSDLARFEPASVLYLVEETASKRKTKVAYFVGPNRVRDEPHSKRVLYRQVLGEKAEALIHQISHFSIEKMSNLPCYRLTLKLEKGQEYEWHLPEKAYQSTKTM